ncbi:hypothetical protein [Actinacidiphila sp. bgisy144]|uniref:hypothetical protein n=1 Tax=unclassified Actinacidiphila TaxID=2995708 RepID=UPI003EBA261F
MPNTPTEPGRLARGDVLRPMLWTLAVLSAVVNMAASYGAAHTWVHLACGAVTVVCGVTLVVAHQRGRR